MTPVPADVYLAARRAYILSSRDLWADDELTRTWAEQRWPGAADGKAPGVLAFWVVSISVQDGRA